MIFGIPPGRAISLLGAAPGAIQITDIVALKDYYGVTFNVLAVSYVPPTSVVIKNSGAPAAPVGYLGDVSIDVNGTLQTGKKVLIPRSYGAASPVYGFAYSSTLNDETSAGNSFVVPNRTPTIDDGYSIIDYVDTVYLKYGTDAGWAGSKYYIEVRAMIASWFSNLDVTSNRARAFYAYASYKTEASAVPVNQSNLTPIYGTINGSSIATFKIPLVGPGSPVNYASFILSFSYFPAFSVTGTSIAEYTEDLISTFTTDRNGY